MSAIKFLVWKTVLFWALIPGIAEDDVKSIQKLKLIVKKHEKLNGILMIEKNNLNDIVVDLKQKYNTIVSQYNQLQQQKSTETEDTRQSYLKLRNMCLQ